MYGFLPLLLIVSVTLPACDGGSREVRVDSDTSSVTVHADGVDSLSTTVTARPVAPREVLVALSGEGLQFVDAATGRTRLVPFGWEKATVEGAFDALRRTGDRSVCANGYEGVRVGEGLTLWFDGGTFTGWSANGGDAIRATTMAGVGVGSTRAEMDSVVGGTFVEGPDGVLFTSGGLRGMLDGADESATIRFISAGSVCDPL